MTRSQFIACVLNHSDVQAEIVRQNCLARVWCELRADGSAPFVLSVPKPAAGGSVLYNLRIGGEWETTKSDFPQEAVDTLARIIADTLRNIAEAPCPRIEAV